MLNKNQERELAYVVRIDDIQPIQGSDNCECAVIGGWRVMVRKGQFKPNDLAVYFEIDSKLPAKECFAFLEKRGYKVKAQRYTFGGKGLMISQGLIMSAKDLGWCVNAAHTGLIEYGSDNSRIVHFVDDESRFVTKTLGVTYSSEEDNARKSKIDPNAKYNAMKMRHKKIFGNKHIKKMMKYHWFREIMFFFFGKKKDKPKGWPVGRFPGVNKTDQERCENMPWVLSDKTPYIKTQKCDGSSGTYILEKQTHKFCKPTYEFYVCSRNVRMLKPGQECFYGDNNYYWEVALKYNIENKMKEYLNKNPDVNWVCWQGEICAPGIQKNPHGLTETHFYCFHMTDSKHGRFDIREAKYIWLEYGMEVVPIIEDNYIMPDDMEEFKLQADGYYIPQVCEGKTNRPREGYVYYKTTDPTFSFKNVSREYLLKHN